jgi:hypothetical protein
MTRVRGQLLAGAAVLGGALVIPGCSSMAAASDMRDACSNLRDIRQAMMHAEGMGQLPPSVADSMTVGADKAESAAAQDDDYQTFASDIRSMATSLANDGSFSMIVFQVDTEDCAKWGA